MLENTTERQARIAGRDFLLSRNDIVDALRSLEPDPIASHFVVIDRRRFPPKQVISAVTGLDRADFTSHQARRTLMRLGFSAGRRGSVSVSTHGTFQGPASQPSSGPAELQADHMRPLAGQWVAIKDDEILFAAATPHRLVGWLTKHGQRADSMFRVPEDDTEGTGLAPL